jgi:AraC-like DNA-binding protein
MIFKDKVYYKYLTVSAQTKTWGLYLTGAGYTEVTDQVEYPLTDHPDHHYFKWSTGRRLSEYQILYITKGKGVFESELSGRKKVKEGDLFILFPDVWHRFSPKKATGWNEYWIEFNGSFARQMQCNLYINPEEPLIHLGLGEDLKEKFLNVIKQVRDEDMTFQFTASAVLMQILAQIAAKKVSGSFKSQDIESQIKQAKNYIAENLNLPISPEKIAEHLDISYSLFRMQFRKYTGFSPIQYQIQLRLQKAREMLGASNYSIKEIATKVGFESTYYFSRLFKQKTGKSPSEFRNGNRR